ncbi:MAG: hypothetical protein M1817_004893 [Caeruleum heppii]|nr:MAG: hypothetical protein M1817_004893 [Caeruleum heppii]
MSSQLATPVHAFGEQTLTMLELMDLLAHAVLLFHAADWTSSIGIHRGILRRIRRNPFASAVDQYESRLWFNVGIIHVHLGEFEAAAESLERAVGAEPDMAIAWFVLATCQFENGAFRRARKAYRRCLETFEETERTKRYETKGLQYQLEKESVRVNSRLSETWESRHPVARQSPSPGLGLQRMPAGLLFEPVEDAQPEDEEVPKKGAKEPIPRKHVSSTETKPHSSVFPTPPLATSIERFRIPRKQVAAGTGRLENNVTPRARRDEGNNVLLPPTPTRPPNTVPRAAAPRTVLLTPSRPERMTTVSWMLSSRPTAASPSEDREQMGRQRLVERIPTSSDVAATSPGFQNAFSSAPFTPRMAGAGSTFPYAPHRVLQQRPPPPPTSSTLTLFPGASNRATSPPTPVTPSPKPAPAAPFRSSSPASIRSRSTNRNPSPTPSFKKARRQSTLLWLEGTHVPIESDEASDQTALPKVTDPSVQREEMKVKAQQEEALRRERRRLEEGRYQLEIEKQRLREQREVLMRRNQDEDGCPGPSNWASMLPDPPNEAHNDDDHPRTSLHHEQRRPRGLTGRARELWRGIAGGRTRNGRAESESSNRGVSNDVDIPRDEGKGKDKGKGKAKDKAKATNEDEAVQKSDDTKDEDLAREEDDLYGSEGGYANVVSDESNDYSTLIDQLQIEMNFHR